jgi:glycosyltransferase involved in cell wall biosynthesis
VDGAPRMRLRSPGRLMAPLLTIGVVSCNRLHYLRALLESMRVCVPLDRVECIVVDNASIEPGLREYVEGIDFLTARVFREKRVPASEAAEALNTIIDRASAPYVLLLTDDVQFIVSGDGWLDGVLELAGAHPHLGSIMPIALRRVTLDRYFDGGWGHRLLPSRVPQRLTNADGQTSVVLFGRREMGITHSALGITAVATWRTIGPFRATGTAQTVQDAGGGAEDDVVRRYRGAGLHLRKALLEVPVLAEIITDPKGTQARVRGNRRYGRYLAPPCPPFYYRIWTEADAGAIPRRQSALAFEDVVEPIGFELPYDANGGRLKNPLGADDPFTWIDASVAGVEFQ